ncbi:MAG TPA: CPBP family intramembrane glutamic endopeptidase [Mucilaginibacter sp.]|nr:CPBP family intramembrane glutamic endopeptidase [Mucilaginibacter sp.]
METDPNELQPGRKACVQCGELIAAKNKFCNHCGASQYAILQLTYKDRWILIKQAAFYYLLDLGICLLALVDAFETLSWLVIFDISSAVIAIAFFAYNWDDTKSCLRWESFSLRKLLTYCGIAIAGQLVVFYAVTWLNITIFSRDVYYYGFFEGYSHGRLLLIFFVAVFPALFEELAYRGYLLQVLLKATDEQQAVYITSLMFAFIHLSFISLFWLVPFALFLGFTRIKEKTIWYGVFIHFSFNLTSCLLDIYAHR